MTSPVLLNDRYRLEHRLGSGGMAVVYQAYDLTLERVVAVKLLRQDFSPHTAFRGRFHQEAKAAANLSHPNIVTVHDYGLAQDFPFIVMEFVPGTDLKHLLQSRGRFTTSETLDLIIQACAGLGYAHRAGLVHCDIKPHNMLITPDHRLKITDFGIARALASIHPEEKASYVWGSPLYFSPEQAAGDAPSPASDVYSLGVVMYEMLCGQLPFLGDSPAGLAYLHQTSIPQPPRELNEDISPVLEQIILKILSKEPSARYRMADQLGHLLLPISRSLEKEENQVDSPKAQRSPSGERKDFPPPGNGISFSKSLPEKKYHSVYDLEPELQGIEWGTWVLVFLALITVGGLVPFWIWVYFR